MVPCERLWSCPRFLEGSRRERPCQPPFSLDRTPPLCRAAQPGACFRSLSCHELALPATSSLLCLAKSDTLEVLTDVTRQKVTRLDWMERMTDRAWKSYEGERRCPLCG